MWNCVRLLVAIWARFFALGYTIVGRIVRILVLFIPLGLWLAFRQPIAVYVEIPIFPFFGAIHPDPFYWYTTFGAFLATMFLVLWALLTFGAAIIETRIRLRKEKKYGQHARPL